MSKKYYWLKLNENFFEREEIKVIEGMKNGKDYILFYMKLLLKSIKTEGRLMFRGVIPYTPDMLSTITNTDVDTVKVATDMFLKLGLMQQLDDGALFMEETNNMIGSETDAAKRMRNMRERKEVDKIEFKDKKRNSVTNELQEVTKSYTEIEKDIELDKEKDIELELDIKVDTKNETSNKKCISLDITTEQITNIESKFPDVDVEFYLEKIKSYEIEKKKKYKDYNLAIQNWIRNDVMKGKGYDKKIKPTVQSNLGKYQIDNSAL